MFARWKCLWMTLALMAGLFARIAEAQEPDQPFVAMRSDWAINGARFVSHYVLFPEMVLDVTVDPGGRVHAGWGLVRKLGDHRIEIRWLSGGVEVGRFSGISDKQCVYAIEAHTDQPQVGIRHTFKAVSLTRENREFLSQQERELRLRLTRHRLEQVRQEEEIRRILNEIEYTQFQSAMERARLWLE